MSPERFLSYCDGSILESLGAVWFAFSPRSGETVVLNDEAAACLEVVMESPRTLLDLTSAIAAETDMPRVQLAVLVEDAVHMLTQAGLLRDTLFV